MTKYHFIIYSPNGELLSSSLDEPDFIGYGTVFGAVDAGQQLKSKYGRQCRVDVMPVDVKAITSIKTVKVAKCTLIQVTFSDNTIQLLPATKEVLRRVETMDALICK